MVGTERVVAATFVFQLANGARQSGGGLSEGDRDHTRPVVPDAHAGSDFVHQPDSPAHRTQKPRRAHRQVERKTPALTHPVLRLGTGPLDLVQYVGKNEKARHWEHVLRTKEGRGDSGGSTVPQPRMEHVRHPARRHKNAADGLLQMRPTAGNLMEDRFIPRTFALTYRRLFQRYAAGRIYQPTQSRRPQRRLPWLPDNPKAIDISTVQIADDLRVVQTMHVRETATPHEEAHRFLNHAVNKETATGFRALVIFFLRALT